MRWANLAAMFCACNFCTGVQARELIVSGSAELHAAIASVSPGDRLLLAPGAYGMLDLGHVAYAPAISIEPLDQAAPPVFSSINLSEVNGLAVEGIVVAYGPTQSPLTSYAVNILGGGDISLTAMEIYSAADGVAGNDAFGVNIRNSAQVSVDGNSIHDVYRGVAVLDSDNVAVRRNVIRTVGSDGVIARGAVGLSILDNYFADFAIVDLELQHPDAIQLWSRYALRANQDIVIRGNLIRRGVGDRSQGVFVNTPEFATTNLVIEHNVIEQSMAQGIAVVNGDGVIIRNNTVIPDDYQVDKPGIEIRAPAANSLVADNIAMAYRLADGALTSGNVTADYFNPWISSFIGRLIEAPASPSRASSFAPVGGVGAAGYVRDLWPGDPSAPARTLTPPAVIADIDFVNGVIDTAPDPIAIARATHSTGGDYYASAPSPKLTAALNLTINARMALPSTAFGWRLIAAVPSSYDLRVDRSRLRFSVWTSDGATRLDAVHPGLLDLTEHDLTFAYDGVAGSMAISVDGVEIARRSAPTGPIVYNPTQRLYVAGAPWGLIFGDGVKNLRVAR
jgi:hypothetical protein